MDIRSIFMGLAFALMWSSAFTSARVIVQYAPPMTSLALRFLVSGILGIAIAYAMGQRIKLSRAQWKATFIFGVCQNALYLGLFFVAMQTIEASLAAILAATMPLIVALFGWVLGDRPRPLGVLGLLLGFGGVAIIMGGRIGGEVDVNGLILCAIGVTALAIATLSVRNASSGGNVLMIVGLQMLVGAAVLSVPAAILESGPIIWSWQLIVAFFYTTLVPGLLATLVWFLLVQRVGAVKAATFHFLNPFFGVVIAAVLLGEALGIADVIGVAIIAAGILAVQLSKQKKLA
ncbi:DMT family transporter [Marivivens donghaensis]|uniref:DMT family transporter n=1 Tax=Marivivens donghaensis TaxID=1699413 RepID=A0ABX0VUS8_9RHOB|nr:DMT family transporter [Marivivens donghaensis]NIY71539.1 DMT family transporter [Marivivens donghaensis]